jgi:hypothetical protein
MASKKILSGDSIMEVLFNEDSEDYLIQNLIPVNQVTVRGPNLQISKKLVKLGGIVESMVLLYILPNVITGTTLPKCTKTSPEGMYRFSVSCVW